jgi:F-box protein, helicase, 18
VTLTAEQHSILSSTGNIKINAVAGSGKTTTVIEYARTRPEGSRILYLAFNKTVKQEAAKKFQSIGMYYVDVETAHSLAYKFVASRMSFTLSKNGYKINEVADILGISNYGEKHLEYVIANHVSKFVAYFCNSDAMKVQELNYVDIVKDPVAKAFVKKYYEYILTQTRIFLSKMNSGEIEITHDFYLKKFQLSAPVLNYDYILFDEGQDASPAMLDVFLSQEATKVIVGDTHQQIYGWRFAVNSLDKMDYKTFHLSTSFRFGKEISSLAMGVLKWKEIVSSYKPIVITGAGISTALKSKATIARTNLGLLLSAIEYITETKNVKAIYFEGNINSYTYADDGASLYDVLNLHLFKKNNIRDSLIKSMRNMEELKDYVKKTEDVQLGMMIEIVEEYEEEIYDILKSLKDKHVPNEEREKAQMIFSTVHRCKGMEYDEVILANDFVSEERLEKSKVIDADPGSVAKAIEEINLLYVAMTRAKKTLHIHESQLPYGHSPAANIKVIKTKEPVPTTDKKTEKPLPNANPKSKSYTYEDKRGINPSAYMPWTDFLDEELTEMYVEGLSVTEMSTKLNRTKGAIVARVKKLELEERFY